MKKFSVLMIAAISAAFAIVQLYLFILRTEGVSKLKSADYILLGDSHTEYINDERIYNSSLGGSSFHWHEKLIKSIPLDGKKVVINVAPHNFSDQYHNRYFSRSHEEWRQLFFVDLPEAADLYRFQWLPKYSSVARFKSFGEGKIASTQRQKQNLSSERLEYSLLKHYGDSTLTDTLEINAFNRIIDLLNKYQLEYVIIQMPHHPTYWHNIPARILTRYEKIVGKFQNQIRYDFVDESHYLDGDHILGLYQGMYLNAEILDEKFSRKIVNSRGCQNEGM